MSWQKWAFLFSKVTAKEPKKTCDLTHPVISLMNHTGDDIE